MALGDLSDDQQRYAQTVASGTGLNPAVVVAWIGAESGWSITKPTHNYLNIGPGRSYDSVDQAAAAVVDLIRNSGHYGGIRAAVPLGAEAQVKAIQDSPWDADHYHGTRLRDTFVALLDRALHDNTLSDSINEIGAWVAGPVTDAIGDAIGAVVPDLGDVGRQVLIAGLGLVFTLGAIALIAMGLNRLTNGSVTDTFSKVAGVAKVAAV